MSYFSDHFETHTEPHGETIEHCWAECVLCGAKLDPDEDRSLHISECPYCHECGHKRNAFGECENTEANCPEAPKPVNPYDEPEYGDAAAC